MENSIHGTKKDFKKVPWKALEIEVVELWSGDVMTASDNANDVMTDDESWEGF